MREQELQPASLFNTHTWWVTVQNGNGEGLATSPIDCCCDNTECDFPKLEPAVECSRRDLFASPAKVELEGTGNIELERSSTTAQDAVSLAGTACGVLSSRLRSSPACAATKSPDNLTLLAAKIAPAAATLRARMSPVGSTCSCLDSFSVCSDSA